MNHYIDLHLHLDGAFTVDIAEKLADLQGIELPTRDRNELKRLLTVPEGCANLTEFLNCFELPISLIQTKEGISEAVYLVASNIRRQGVIYAEIRFAPQSSTKMGLTQEEVVLAALDGLKRTNLKANLILCFIRGNGNEEANNETLEVARKYLVEDGGVVAVDLAGAEALFPTSKYKELFNRVRELEIPFTIHAGEAAGADSVWEAVNFGAKRIGHGVRIYDDPALVQEVKKRGIVLEMCPTSNMQTVAIEDWSKYPFMDYLKEGIKVTLNTDDMGIEGTTLEQEYEYMKERFGLSEDDEKIIINNAIDAAFTTEEVRDTLRKVLNTE